MAIQSDIIMINSRIKELIKTRLGEFKSDPENLNYYYNKVAAQYDVLPLYLDWERCWAIRADGEIVMFFHDDTFTPDAEVGMPHQENSPRLRNVALAQGSKKYPELQELIEKKPADAEDCPFCVARGIDPDKVEEIGLVCYCGGLGWVPKDDGSHEKAV